MLSAPLSVGAGKGGDGSDERWLLRAHDSKESAGGAYLMTVIVLFQMRTCVSPNCLFHVWPPFDHFSLGSVFSMA